MVQGRPHEIVLDADKRNFEKNLGEDVREIVLTFDVAWNRANFIVAIAAFRLNATIPAIKS